MSGEPCGYAICTTPRSGSNFLCGLLDSTGLLGHPVEYFNPAALRLRGLPEFTGEPQRQLQQARTLGITENGVYGINIFAQHFDYAASTAWARELPNLTFVFL